MYQKGILLYHCKVSLFFQTEIIERRSLSWIIHQVQSKPKNRLDRRKKKIQEDKPRMFFQEERSRLSQDPKYPRIHVPSAPQSQTSIGDGDEIEGCKTGILSGEKLQTVQKSEFYRDLCVQQVDLDKFLRKYRWRDQLLMVSGQKVSGKGFDDERLRNCYIYLQRGRDRYTLGLAEDAENKEIFYKIPENIIFDIIGKGKEIFVILSINNSELSVYKLPDDVNVEIYFETDLYEGDRNLFYGYISRELRYNLKSCSITADPRSAEIFFRSFAMTIDYKDYNVIP